jgi:hypothetical protein
MMVGFAWWVYETLVVSPNRRFKFNERHQLFIRVHNETLPVVAMCVGNPDRSPVGINRRYHNVIETHEHAGDFKEP